MAVGVKGSDPELAILVLESPCLLLWASAQHNQEPPHQASEASLLRGPPQDASGFAVFWSEHRDRPRIGAGEGSKS